MRFRSKSRVVGALSSLALAAGFATAAQAADDGGAADGAAVNTSGATFESSVVVEGTSVTVTVSASGVSPDLPHAQHIHVPDDTRAVCPPAAADTNGDGVVSTAEGQPFYGGVAVALTTSGDTSPTSALAVDRFPVAAADGTYTYRRTFTVPADVAPRLMHGAIVVHGDDLDDSGSYDGAAPSSLDPSLPLEATVPTACGEIDTQHLRATADGSTLNGSGTSFGGSVQLNGTHATVALSVSGAAEELPHAQHIHSPLGTQAVCPPPEADDNSDGLITTVEGVPFYGGVQASLTTTGDTSATSALAVDRFPVADGDGRYTYVRSFEVTPEIADDILNGALVVHGRDTNDNGTYDGAASTLDPSVPQEATLPVACGDIEVASFTGSVRGSSLNESGAWFDALVDVDGTEVTVQVNASGVTPNQPHAQHLHIDLDPVGTMGSCPAGSADTNDDGIIDTAEGLPSYGPVQVALTTAGDTSASSGLAVDRFPVADTDGEYSYSRTFSVSPEIAENLANGVIVVHGADLDDSGSYDGEAPSSLDPSLPLEATVPVACGQVSLQNEYQAVNPERILDTRNGNGAPAESVDTGETIELQVAGRGGVPTTGVTAVALNITSTLATTDTFITVWPTGGERPYASSLNPEPGMAIPNLVITAMGPDGSVSLYNEFGSVDLIADVMGYFPGGSGMQSVTPHRILDTRDGTGAPDAPLGAASTLELDVTGVGGVPADGVDSVVFNLTSANVSERSWVAAWPTGENRPGTSVLNTAPGLNSTNLVIAKVGAGGNVNLYNNTGSTELIADVVGWFPDGTNFTGLNPERLLDTRTGLGAPQGRVGPDSILELDVTGVGGVPADDVGSVVLNVTATQSSDRGWTTIWPGGANRPLASNLNLMPDIATMNQVVVKVGPDGTVNLYNFTGNTHLIVDVMGYVPR